MTDIAAAYRAKRAAEKPRRAVQGTYPGPTDEALCAELVGRLDTLDTDLLNAVTIAVLTEFYRRRSTLRHEGAASRYPDDHAPLPQHDHHAGDGAGGHVVERGERGVGG